MPEKPSDKEEMIEFSIESNGIEVSIELPASTLSNLSASSSKSKLEVAAQEAIRILRSSLQ